MSAMFPGGGGVRGFTDFILPERDNSVRIFCLLALKSGPHTKTNYKKTVKKIFCYCPFKTKTNKK